jgi:hypothetical protein
MYIFACRFYNLVCDSLLEYLYTSSHCMSTLIIARNTKPEIHFILDSCSATVYVIHTCFYINNFARMFFYVACMFVVLNILLHQRKTLLSPCLRIPLP